ncbi:MAG: diguanylate cyclase [Actinobacteria bacterium]|nr:diguanylate cyclase [Actinomycetota bacterium]
MRNENNILIIDDDPKVRKTLSDVFKVKRYKPVAVATGEAAIKKVDEENIDIVLIDLKLEDISGIKLMKKIKNLCPDIECIILTGYASEDTAIEAVNLGAYSYIKKPCSMEQLLLTIRRAIERKKGKAALKESEEKYRLLVNNQKDFITEFDTSSKVLFINPSLCEFLGKTEKELLGKKFILFIHKDDQEAVKKIIENIVKPPYTNYIEVRMPVNNKWIWVEWKNKALLNKDGSITNIIAIGRDITDRIREQEELKYISFHDKLTNLYNRAYFEEELKRLNKVRQLPLSIIIGDVNSLKLVNDAFGYEQGDKLLIKIAEILKNCCRAEDIVSRWGGDEFSILLPKTTEDIANKFISRVRTVCKKTTDYNVPISISLGVSTKVNKEENISKIVKKAEDKMHRCKLLETKKIQSLIILNLENKLWGKNRKAKEHAKKLKELSIKFGEKIGMSKDNLDELALLTVLHDIGKLGIQDSILSKSSRLTKKEWSIVKKHPEIGYNIALSSPKLLQIAEAILYHHEWWDGKGYPQKLKGKNIPLISRILTIIEAYDAMTYGRCYKKPINRKEAIKELRRCSGTQFDPQLVGKFLNILEN